MFNATISTRGYCALQPLCTVHTITVCRTLLAGNTLNTYRMLCVCESAIIKALHGWLFFVDDEIRYNTADSACMLLLTRDPKTHPTSIECEVIWTHSIHIQTPKLREATPTIASKFGFVICLGSSLISLILILS